MREGAGSRGSRRAAGERLCVPGGLTLAFAPDGRLRAEVALGADEVRIGPEVIPLLARFATPRAPAAAIRDLRRAGVAPEAARRAIERLRAAGVLVPERGARGGRGALATAAFADLEVHRRLLLDVRRIERFGAAIARAAPGRTVLEVGTGTGVLAVLAARAGARRVVAVEETGVAAIARELVRANGVASKVEVVEGSSREVSLERRADVLVAELLGGDPLDERIVETIADARERLVARDAAVIPGRLAIAAVLVESPDPRLDPVRRAAELDEAARALGVDLGPVRRALDAGPPPSFTAEVRGLEGGARVLTGELSLARLDLERGDPFALRRAAASPLRVPAARGVADGVATALAVYFRADLGGGIELSNAPFAPETHWGQLVVPLARSVRIRAGERIAPHVATLRPVR